MSGTSDAGGPPGAPAVDLGIPGIVETEEIGRGGFAVVYRGRRQGFDQSVAVKILAAALDNESRQRFDREVRAMGALFGHPASSASSPPGSRSPTVPTSSWRT